jgi:hypothetical protein
MYMSLRSSTEFVLSSLALLAFLLPSLTAQGRHTFRPKEGYVRDAETAIKIAEAVLSPIYGIDKVEQERPFVAKLKGSIWHVRGALNRDPSGTKQVGGVAVVEISKKDGRIRRVSHGR